MKPHTRNDNPHVTQLFGRVLEAEDGLLLGNGDLSVSIYQRQDEIVWRFGKGDVWDRRLDLSIDPKPAHIDEIAHGLAVEGWKCGPYGGPVEATKGTKNPGRMREICQGAPPSHFQRPYPCPKPVGELALHFPADLCGLEIEQRLVIEEAVIHLNLTWAAGLRLDIECFIPPTPNVLVVRWKLTGGEAPLRFSLYRWADPTIREFGENFFARSRHKAFLFPKDPSITPLPPPTVTHVDGLPAIEQSFHPEPTFPRGFRCRLVPLASSATIEPVDMGLAHEARLHIAPPKAQTGELMIAVLTGSDPLPHLPSAESLALANRDSARRFWSKSSVQLGDSLLEKLWYETLHARRCAYRADTTPPGLFLPSTVQDYSHWHGDYHMNYNFQSPFLGDYVANHLEIGDAYFEGLKYFLPVGRKIAHDYYNCRGVFIQLSGFPLLAEDDPLGSAPMGRMAYMTGWAANQYWSRYRYTLDKEWLRGSGYPVIRDCALFYTDFLKKRDDGLYHAYPSNQGEDGFNGSTKEYTDRPQVMRHARYCLRCAIAAAETLGTDSEWQNVWREILQHLAPEDGSWEQQRGVYPDERSEIQPPEFIGFDFVFKSADLPPEFVTFDADLARRKADPSAPSVFDDPSSELWEWYAGKLPYRWMQALRTGAFLAERDLPAIRRLLNRWRHENGLIWAMCISRYGHAGAWTESLGVIGPLQEMLLQSWDGVIRPFPAWAKSVDAAFTSLRAEGAFLVSAELRAGAVQNLRIESEKGFDCTVQNPWPGSAVRIIRDGRPGEMLSGHHVNFKTTPGETVGIEAQKDHEGSQGDSSPASQPFGRRIHALAAGGAGDAQQIH